MNRKELIEEATTAMSRGYVKDGRTSSFFELAEIAFAVFEKAQAPTDDEREALIEEATWVLIKWDTDTVDRGVGDEHYRERRADIERVFPILFRRPAQAEPTDAQVERAARSVAEWNTSDVPLELCRAVARDALRAAFTAGQEEQS